MNNQQANPIISDLVFIGDSLTDRGTLEKRKLGPIRLRWIVGLQESDLGRFTNDLNWADYLIKHLMSLFNQEQKKQSNHTDCIAKLDKQVDQFDLVNNDKYVDYRGRVFFARSYAEGGLSDYSYREKFSDNFSVLIDRQILSYLSQKRRQLFRDDNYFSITQQQKQQTLVMEWSGANDLITVNTQPTIQEADNAIKERILNATELLKHGYQHIVLFNLPDLSKTPRYQGSNVNNQSREQLSNVVCYYNKMLENEVAKLNMQYPQYPIGIYNVFDKFNELINDPEKYGFDKNLINTPYSTSQNEDNPKMADKYIFWDDIHPTSKTHEILSQDFYKNYLTKYCTLQSPKAYTKHDLCVEFQNRYNAIYESDINGIFGLFRKSRLSVNYQENNALEVILKHGLYEHGYRTRRALQELKWISKDGAVNLTIREVRDAYEALYLKNKARSKGVDSLTDKVGYTL